MKFFAAARTSANPALACDAELPLIRFHNRRTLGRMAVLLLSGLFCSGLAGCTAGPKWDPRPYQEAHYRARERNAITLVYFRSWYSVACTRFEERVLADAEVRAEADRLVCVQLDYDAYLPFAEQWGVDLVPAIVLIGPSGELLARLEAPIGPEALLDAIHRARDKVYGTESSPSGLKLPLPRLPGT